MAEGQAVVGGHVASAEARAAETGLDDRAGLQQLGRHAHARQCKAHGDGRGIDVHGEIAIADRAAAQDLRSLVDVVKHAARAARDDALVGPDRAVVDLTQQVHVGLRPAFFRLGLDPGEQFLCIGKEFADGVGIRRVERQSDHRLDGGQVDLDHAVIIRAVAGGELLIRLRAAMDLKESLRLLIGLPDGGQTGGLGRHDVDAVAEVDGQTGNTGTGEFQHAVFDEAGGERRLHQRERHIMRADAAAGLARQIDQHDLGQVRVPRVPEELLGELRPALAHGHGAERAVARMRIRAQDHRAAGRHLLARVGMDDALVGGHVDAAVFLGRGQAEDVIVLVDRAADGAEAVMAVGQRVGNGKFPHAAGPGLLDDADVGDVVRKHGVKVDPELFLVAGLVVRLQDAVGHRQPPPVLRADGSAALRHAAAEENAVVRQFHGWSFLPVGFSFVTLYHRNAFLKSVPAKIHKFCFFHNSASDRRPFLQDFTSLPSFPVRRSCILPPLPV